MTFTFNLILICYYFERLLLSSDINSPRRCALNNGVECYAVLNLTLTYYFETLSRDINNPRRLCKQKLAEGSMTFERNLSLTCYGKQSAILNFS